MLLSILLQAAAGAGLGKLGAALGAAIAVIGAGIGIGKIWKQSPVSQKHQVIFVLI